ncbi:hypothetical protein [Escherichia fergusonii]|uniref:hypothetical protein n=1 Tax=Escherichia fergusonii TaxID=564 RepID=UPI0006147234|nr:hypothetical protein [Escherichia fergusonii]KWW08286.1 hypothetical protein VL22_0201480 [Escherichia fergusonii]
MHKFIAAMLLTFGSISVANAEGWYIAKNSLPAVLSDDGNWYIFIARSKGNEPGLYLTPYRSQKCTTTGESVPMQINGVKVRMHQDCDSDMGIYWYPSTRAGTNHIFNEFMNKKSVTFDENGFIMRFSGSGFVNTTRTFIDNLSNPGI